MRCITVVIKTDLCRSFVVFSLTVSALTISCAKKEAEQDTGLKIEKLDFNNSMAEGYANKHFNYYVQFVKGARFDEANQILRECLEKDYKGVTDEYEAFLIKKIPQSSRLTVSVYDICDACSKGECIRCGGSGSCKECNDTGICALCNGTKGAQKKCTSCICDRCRGSGRCPACSGYGKYKCPTCQGYARGTQGSEKIECRGCKGQGMVGTRPRRRCTVCSGRGWVEESTSSECPTCGRRGYVVCTSCKSGRCPDCGGSGYDSYCGLCKGTRVQFTPCASCSGSGKCNACKGMAKCYGCRGSGLCTKCTGMGIVNKYRLPMNRDWLMHPESDIWVVAGVPVDTSEFMSHGEEVSVKVNKRMVSVKPSRGEIICVCSPENYYYLINSFIKGDIK